MSAKLLKNMYTFYIQTKAFSLNDKHTYTAPTRTTPNQIPHCCMFIENDKNNMCIFCTVGFCVWRIFLKYTVTLCVLPYVDAGFFFSRQAAYGRIREHRLCLVENMYCYVYLSALYIRFMGHIRGGIHGLMMDEK